MRARREDVLARYDLEERFAARPSDGIREETPHLVRHVRPVDRESFVSFVRVDAANADRVIRDEIAYFRQTGRSFEWKHFGHDGPADLLERLASAGAEIGDEEALMVLDLADPPALVGEPPMHDVRMVGPGDDPLDFLALGRAISPGHAKELEVELRAGAVDRGETVLFVGYLDEQPMSYGRLTLTEGSSFAGLYGGATLPPARGRGLYRALVAARVREARSRGRRYATVDAGEMSRPILERLGFTLLSTTRPCTWTGS